MFLRRLKEKRAIVRELRERRGIHAVEDVTHDRGGTSKPVSFEGVPVPRCSASGPTYSSRAGRQGVRHRPPTLAFALLRPLGLRQARGYGQTLPVCRSGYLADAVLRGQVRSVPERRPLLHREATTRIGMQWFSSS
jgi:hypothetical protein